MSMLLQHLATTANVRTPESDTSPGAVFLRKVEAATTRTLALIDGERAAAGLPLALDDEAFDHHTHADVWPAVDAAIGDRKSAEAQAARSDLGLQGAPVDGLARAAFDLSSALETARW